MPKYRVSGVALIEVEWAVKVEADSRNAAICAGNKVWEDNPRGRGQHTVIKPGDSDKLVYLGPLAAEERPAELAPAITPAAPTQLLPCPFCGGVAYAMSSGATHDFVASLPYYVRCDNLLCCGFTLSQGFRTPEIAAEAWNERAGLSGNTEPWR